MPVSADAMLRLDVPPHCGQSAARAIPAPSHAPTLQQSNAAHAACEHRIAIPPGYLTDC